MELQPYSAYQQSSNIYGQYTKQDVEGTTLVYSAMESYSSGFSIWNQYFLNVLLINFNDDWIGVSFLYQDDNNYFRFEMNSQEKIRRLKRLSNGNVTILWDEPNSQGYDVAVLYLLNIQYLDGMIRIFMDPYWRATAGMPASELFSYKYEASLKNSTFGLWTAASKEAYFLGINMFRPFGIAKHSNQWTVGGIQMTVRGQNLMNYDFTPISRSHSTSCAFTIWVSDSALVCRVTTGIRASKKNIVSIGIVVGTASFAFSSDIPSFSNLLPANTPSTGSISMTVSGINIGRYESSSQARNYGSAAEATEWQSMDSLLCFHCNLPVWGSDTSIRSMTPASTSATSKIQLTVALRSGSLTEGFSFDHMCLSNFMGSGNGAGTGSMSVTVFGASFGQTQASIGKSIGLTACEATRWESETSVRCQAGLGSRGSGQ
eukprot:748287-Hanusia_phi.AAC.1